MAIINCPYCKREISDKAIFCPYCELPSKYFYPTQEDDLKTAQNVEESIKDFDLSEFRNALNAFDADYSSLFATSEYIDSKLKNEFQRKYETYQAVIRNQLIAQYMKNNSQSMKIHIPSLESFISRMEQLDNDVSAHNREYINKKLIELEAYFDHILEKVDTNIKLDEEQRKAIVTDDNHCLIVAGAGSGKTTTMAAKVKYLVEKKGIDPKEIVVISYTNKAIDELKERINKKLNIPVPISTFHSFAFDIIRKAKEDAPELQYSSFNIILEILSKTIFENKALMKNLVLFLGYYFDLPDDWQKYSSLNEYHLYKSAQDFETLKSGLGEYIQKVANARSGKVRTITGEFLRSVQEVQIANCLYLNGIEYVYEDPYPYQIPRSRKKYTPDFHIIQDGREAYIEHYTLNESGKSFLLDAKQTARYQKRIADKRNIHKQNQTDLIETWSFYTDTKPLLDHLREELGKNGFTLKPRNLEEIYQKIVDTGRDKYVFKFIAFTMDFIEQFKTHGFDENGFKFLRNSTDNVRIKLYIDIVEEIYRYYQASLKENNQIDFADMINDANDLFDKMQEQSISVNYKYIIIDEFQDIARQRFTLTQKLSEITNAKVIAVGDDWQSIFAFAGSDITLFTKFLELMGSGQELKITHTYRNSQELIDIAGGFIQKNSSQIKKRLVSEKKLENPIRLIPYDDSSKVNKHLAEAVNESIRNIVSEFGHKSSILLIGRYNYDAKNLLDTEEFYLLPNNQMRSKKFPKVTLQFLTAHSSKGLGYDNVIILNMREAKFGFPSQIEDDPIMKLVTYDDRSVPYAEERRLFYVALTRTKNRVYIATPLSKPSRFLVELIKEYDIPFPEDMNLGFVDLINLRCPECNYPLRYQLNKNYGLGLYHCTNEPEVCGFMTNDRVYLKDIFQCPVCQDGYMIVKRNEKEHTAFYGCTNYKDNGKGCNNTVSIVDPPSIVQRSIPSKNDKLIIKQSTESTSTQNTPVDPVKNDIETKSTNTFSIEKVRETYPSAYKQWTPEEEQNLVNEYHSGKSVKELVEHFGRKPGGIRARLKKLGLIE